MQVGDLVKFREGKVAIVIAVYERVQICRLAFSDGSIQLFHPDHLPTVADIN